MRHVLMVAALAGCTMSAAPEGGPPDSMAQDPQQQPTGSCDHVVFACTVTNDCGTAPASQRSVTICSASTDRETIEHAADDVFWATDTCTDAETVTSSCLAAPDAFMCPTAYDLELGTACVDAAPYDSPLIADVCAHLPPNDGSQKPACSVACDAEAMKAYAVEGQTMIAATCESTDGLTYYAIARL